MRKPIILTFLGCYLPGYKSGGPVRSIANMVEKLGDKLDFRIITSDRDIGDAQSYQGVVVDGWNTVGKAQVFYASPKNQSLKSWVCLISETPHDVLYLNSFFSPVFTIRPLLALRLGLIPRRPVVLAPRGEFSKGAFTLKWWKKTTYILCTKFLGLYKNITWQASSEYEVADIRKLMAAKKKINVAADIASDLPAICMGVADEEMKKLRVPGEPLHVCFLSRISPKKNLDYALRVLSEVTVPVEFTIYGVNEDESYWKNCQEIITRMPDNISVNYHGVIDNTNVAKTLPQHDLFFFPTRGENFGHVIHEALSAGLPVLISDQTPWRNLEALGVGWDLPLNEADKFRTVIETQAALKGEAQVAKRQLAQQYAKRIATDKKALSDNLNLFMDLIIREH